MSFLVATTIRVSSSAIIVIRIPQVSGLMPNPSQFTETAVTETLAMVAIVIQPR